MGIDSQLITRMEDNFHLQVLEANTPVLVDCWADWCKVLPINPVFSELAIEFAGSIKIVRLNIAEAEHLAAHYRVQAIPTLLLFDHGCIVERIIGTVTRQLLVEQINGILMNQVDTTSGTTCL